MSINVLSLFDGISCCQLALKKSGIKIDNYFASEIDKHAITVTQANWPKTVQLGSVVDINPANLSKINLLAGGSPCQSFSFAGKKNGMSTFDNQEILTLEHYLDLKDKNYQFKGQSYLFWEYVRILNSIKPDFFLLENVKMAKKWENVITETLGVEPVRINSRDFSAQNRERLYWTNIFTKPVDFTSQNVFRDVEDKFSPHVYIPATKTVNRVEKKNYMQYDINGLGNGSQDQRAYYMDSKFGTLGTNGGHMKILQDDKIVRFITRNECERLQTIPDDYTISVSENQAKKCIGNGWTVDVISHIFNSLP